MNIDQYRLMILLSKFGMNGGILNNKIQSLKMRAIEYKHGLQITNPKWKFDSDARFIILNKYINVCDLTQFKLNLLGKMIDDDWYSNLIENDTQLEQDYKNLITSNFESSLKFSFGMSVFTLVENCFRIFLRSIDPYACNGATAEFQSIYGCLLGRSHLNFNDFEKENAFSLLELVRNIRNLIHNDGVFFSKDGKDRVVNYLGKSFLFQNGKMANFVTWDLLVILANEILDLIMKVVSHPQILRTEKIDDPFLSY